VNGGHWSEELGKGKNGEGVRVGLQMVNMYGACVFCRDGVCTSECGVAPFARQACGGESKARLTSLRSTASLFFLLDLLQLSIYCYN